MYGFAVKLKAFCREHGVSRTKELLSESIKTGKVRRDQLSIRGVTEGLVGPDWVAKLGQPMSLLESQDAVDVSAFHAITGQLLVDMIKEMYESAEWIGDMLCKVVPITNGNLGEHKEPGLSRVVDAPSKLQPGQRYPQTGFTPQYVVYPKPSKFGLICALTMEMIFADLTGQVFESAGDVGRAVRQNREEKQLQVVLGLVNNHQWNGTSYNTYQTSTPWINVKSSWTLNDWNDINTLEQLFVNMTDPVTGKAISVPPNERSLLVMPGRRYKAKRAFAATNTVSGVYPTSGSPANRIDAPNPLDTQYPILSSAHAYNLLVASGLTADQAIEYSYLGAFKRSFVYREVYGFRTAIAPPNSPAEFEQDIVHQVKAGEFGEAGVKEPRFTIKGYNT